MIRHKTTFQMRPVASKEEKFVFDYKDPETLKRFMTERGDILSRERSGLAAKQHRMLTKQIKRARHIALLPFVTTL